MTKLDTDMKPWTWSKLLFNKKISMKDIENDYENNIIFKKQFNTYMIFMYFSMSPHYNLLVNELNVDFLFNDKPEYLYKYLYYVLPKKSEFIRWIKGEKFNEKKLIIDEDLWNRIFPEMRFKSVDKDIMEYIQEELKEEFKELKSQIK